MIEKSLAATLEMQRWPKDLPVDRGGWRYITDDGTERFRSVDHRLAIDVSPLGAKRGLHVPQQPIDDAVAYVRRTFNARYGTFGYVIGPHTRMAAAA